MKDPFIFFSFEGRWLAWPGQKKKCLKNFVNKNESPAQITIYTARLGNPRKKAKTK